MALRTCRGRRPLPRAMAAPLAAVLLCAGSACVLKKPPDAAAIKEQALPGVDTPASWSSVEARVGAIAGNWVEGFNDPLLTAAVKEAIARNADLRLGAARVLEAQYVARLAGANLYPSADLIARGGGKMSGDSSGLKGAAFVVAWELDLWGRVRYGRAAAVADAAAAQADFNFARQSIAATVAKTWFMTAEASLQAEVARGTIRDSEQLLQLAETRARVGVGNDEEVFVARANVGTYRDSLRQIELARSDSIRALEILLGRYPAGAVAVTAKLPDQPAAIPAGLPSELLERRPDVIAAERRIAAAFNRRQEARAARLPQISLTAGVNTISSELFVLQERDNPVWSAGARLLVPVFRGGALKTQVDIRTAEQEQAVAAYASIGLRAFGEVENALAAEIAARDREQILTQTLTDFRGALQVVNKQFEVGKTDLRFVTQRQLATNAAQSALVRVQAEQRIQRVNLHLALGGDFASPQQPQP